MMIPGNVGKQSFKRPGAWMTMAAAFSSSWTLPSSAPSFSDLQSALQKAGVSRVFLLRHGQTAPKVGHDFDRVLTDTGRDQARQAGNVFLPRLQPLFATALVSPAPRTMETAQLVLQNYSTVTIEPIASLYDGTMQPEGGPLFRALGYAPLDDYVNHADPELRTTARQLLGQYAADSMRAIVNVLSNTESADTTARNQTVLLVGHAVYLPAIAWGLAVVSNIAPDAILGTPTAEAEGYLVDWSLYQAEYWSRKGQSVA